MLKPQSVRQFVIAAKSGSFKAAADATFRSQAAVSIAMRELEKAVGGELLERDHRGKLTPLANAVLPLFQALVTAHDAVLAQSRELAQGRQGSLSMAVAPFLAEQWLPDIVGEIAERHPGVRIRTIEERSSHILGLVADGTVDIGIAGLLESDSRLSVRAVARDHYGVLCHPTHRFARGRSVAWSSLDGERLIGSDALEALMAAGLKPRPITPDLVITSRAPLLACVERGLGITVLPMLTRPLDPARYAFVPLTRPTLARTVGIVTRAGESMLPAARRLVEVLAESLRAFARSRGAKPGAR